MQVWPCWRPRRPKCYHMWEICGPEFIRRRSDHARFWTGVIRRKEEQEIGEEVVEFLRRGGYGWGKRNNNKNLKKHGNSVSQKQKFLSLAAHWACPSSSAGRRSFGPWGRTSRVRRRDFQSQIFPYCRHSKSNFPILQTFKVKFSRIADFQSQIFSYCRLSKSHFPVLQTFRVKFSRIADFQSQISRIAVLIGTTVYWRLLPSRSSDPDWARSGVVVGLGEEDHQQRREQEHPRLALLARLAVKLT